MVLGRLFSNQSDRAERCSEGCRCILPIQNPEPGGRNPVERRAGREILQVPVPEPEHAHHPDPDLGRLGGRVEKAVQAHRDHPISYRPRPGRQNDPGHQELCHRKLRQGIGESRLEVISSALLIHCPSHPYNYSFKLYAIVVQDLA